MLQGADVVFVVYKIHAEVSFKNSTQTTLGHISGRLEES